MIRDHIEKFELPDEFLAEHLNEANSLRALAVGLDYLYRQVKKVEQAVAARISPKVKIWSMGNDPLTHGAPKDLVICSFHWYAVSSCNYVGLVGWLRRLKDASAPSPKEYVNSVLPDVLVWRNKVAAHFAQTFPAKDKRDSMAERYASVLAPVGFSEDTFYASSLTVMLRRGDETSTSAAMKPWSLTKVHELLRARYWPSDDQENR